MKKSVKWMLSLAAVLILAGLWTWRFIEVNRFYYELDANDGCDEEYYEIGETVVFGDNMIAGVSADGYTIRVNSVDYTDFAPYTNEDNDQLFKDDKMVLVHATVSHVAKGKSEKGVNISDMDLDGIDCHFYQYYHGLGLFNPELDSETTGIRLPVGASYDVVIPFHALKRDFSRRSWEHLDEQELYLTITGYFPTCKIIKVQ